MDTSTTAPNVGQGLSWDGTNWVPTNISGADPNELAVIIGTSSSVVVNNGNAVPFNTANINLNSRFNTSTYTYTVANSGYYRITWSIRVLTASSGRRLGLKHNSNIVYWAEYPNYTTTGSYNDNKQAESFIINASANDTFRIEAFQGNVTCHTLESVLQVERLFRAEFVSENVPINDLSDVDTTTTAPTDGQTLVWDSTLSNWVPGAGIGLWVQNANKIYYNTDNVGIGTNNPGAPLHIYNSSLAELRLQMDSANTNRAAMYINQGGTEVSAIGRTVTGTNALRIIQRDDNPIEFLTNDVQRMSLTGSNLGIGTASPNRFLEIYTAGDTAAIRLNSERGTSGAAYTEFYYGSNRKGVCGKWDSSNNAVYLTSDDGWVSIGGNGNTGTVLISDNTLGVGATSLAAGTKLHLHGQSNPCITRLQSNQGQGGKYIEMYNSSSRQGWIGFGSTTNNNLSIINEAGASVVLGTLANPTTIASGGNMSVTGTVTASGTVLSFTGQHFNKVEGINKKKVSDYEGLIVCANKNEYLKLNGETVTGVDAITIDEALPVLSLSTLKKDKSVYGVISRSEESSLESNTRTQQNNGFAVSTVKEIGDQRVIVNSLGEGGIWVCNSNGVVEAGDLITTSDIPGYGMRQDDDVMRSCTVAKSTMFCNFTPVQKYKKIIKKKEDDEGRLINDLDANGEMQWVNTKEKEFPYRARCINDKGEIITFDQYQSLISKGHKAYIAAFVGCTYHCG